MKKVGFIAGIIASVAFLTSCEEFDTMFDDVGISMSSGVYEFEHCIPPSPAGVEVVMEEEMEIDIEQMMIDEGYENATINSVKLESAVVEVSEKSNLDNLDALDYLNIAIVSDALPEELIATCQNDTLSGVTTIEMEAVDTELKDYIEGSSYALNNYGMLRETTTDTLWVVCKVQYKVDLAVSSK